MADIRIVEGCFGSGKTELAMTMALEAAAQGKKTVLADLDIVNPFFTSGMHSQLLTQKGIRVIAPEVGEDSMSLSSEVAHVFDHEWDTAVIDLAGDVGGATVAGSFYDKLMLNRANVTVFFVVNIYRPMSERVEEICEAIARIEEKSRLKVDYLVNNANLGKDTRPSFLTKGDQTLKEVSRITGIPVGLYMGSDSILIELERQYPGRCSGQPLPVSGVNRPSWIDSTHRAYHWSRSGG